MDSELNSPPPPPLMCVISANHVRMLAALQIQVWVLFNLLIC